MPIVRTQKYKIAGALVVIGVLGYLGHQLYSNSVGVRISTAQTCFDNGDFDCARENLNLVLAKNPNHLDALLMMCRIDFRTKNHQTLEPMLRQVLGIQPGLIEARKMLTTLLLSKCRFLETEQELEILREAGAFSAEEQGQLALVKAGLMVAATRPLEMVEEVSGAIENALTLNPGQPEAHLANAILSIQLGDGQKGFEEVQVAQQAMGETFMTQWAMGRSLFILGDLANASTAFERADLLRKQDRTLRPPGAWIRELYLNQGLVFIEQGNLEEAQRRLDVAIENDPQAARPALALVNLFLIQAGVAGQDETVTEESKRFYRRAVDELTQKPDLLASNPVYRYQLALIHTYLRNFREGMGQLVALASQDPPYLQALQELGTLRNLQANYRGAAEAFGRIVELSPEDVVAGYNHGTLLLRIREVEKARDRLEEVSSKKPDWVQARLNLALAYRLSGMYNEAFSAYQQILERSENNMNALIGLGLIASARGDLETARQNFDRAREFHPERSEPYFYLGQIELQAGRTAEAQSLFEKCLSIDPENEYAILALVDIRFRRGTWEQAKEPLRMILDNPNARLRVVAENAMALVQLMTGNREEAETLLKRLEESSSEVEPYLQGAILTNKAILLAENGDFDRAIEVAQRVVGLLPSEAEPYYNQGCLQLEAGRFSEASFLFKRAIEIDPNNSDARFNLAVAQSALNRWDEALGILSRLSRTEDAPLEVIQSLADAYLGAGDPQAALDILTPTIEKRGGNVQLQTLRVKALIGTGNLKEAARLSQELAANYPQDGDVQMARGMAAFLTGDRKAGETSLRRAVQILKDDPNAKLNLATLLIAKGDYDDFQEAETLLDEVEKKNLFLDEVAKQRAFLAARRSDFETARAFLRKSLQQNGDQPEIEALLNRWEGL